MDLNRLMLQTQAVRKLEFSDLSFQDKWLERPLLVYGSGYVAKENFKFYAPKLAFYSVAVLNDIDKNDLEEVSVIAKENNFRAWEPPGKPFGAFCWIKWNNGMAWL